MPEDEEDDVDAPRSGMGWRGVSRPFMGQGDPKQEGGDSGGGMSAQHRRDTQIEHHHRTYWVYWLIVLLGLWHATGPFTFHYDEGAVQAAGGRWLPWDLETRAAAMAVSDVVSGMLLVFFGLRGLDPFRPKALWGAGIVGIWMNLAPLVLWSPTAVGYYSNVLVGSLVIALAILVPGMPWMIMMMKHGSTVPSGWTYNPSSWPQRMVMVVTGLAGWLVSRWLAAYQMGYHDTAWDPFFGDGTRKVLTSNMSEMWPISDAGLGAFSYTFETLMAFMGGPQRWRTMPWMVTFFGILVIPFGLTHIALVISQPVVVGHWCTMCLLAAAIMLPMIPLAVDEVVAMAQFLRQAKNEGKPFWRTFWKGGTSEGGGPDDRSPSMWASPFKVTRSMFWGMSFPWSLVATTGLGLWLFFAPHLFGLPIQALPADSDHLVGAVIVVVSVVSMAEVVRAGRLLLIPLGLWLLVAPWVLPGVPPGQVASDMVVGLAVIALAVPKGVVRERYGAWQPFIR